VATDSASRMDAIQAEITALGYGTPEYHEAMWFLLSIMARRQACIADRLRADRRKRERAAETRRLRKEERERCESTPPE
jgi:hypothetical protein